MRLACQCQRASGQVWPLLYGFTLKSRHSWRPHVTLRARDPWRATNPLDTQGEGQPRNAQDTVSLSSNRRVTGLGPQRSAKKPVHKWGLRRPE